MAHLPRAPLCVRGSPEQCGPGGLALSGPGVPSSPVWRPPRPTHPSPAGVKRYANYYAEAATYNPAVPNNPTGAGISLPAGANSPEMVDLDGDGEDLPTPFSYPAPAAHRPYTKASPT